MKTILGLDLGTNSIGWALTEQNFSNKTGCIKALGSRIIPMSQDILGKFDAGQSISQTAERTGYRGVRRLLERNLLRRERLHRVLNLLGFLPEHYSSNIDFDFRLGQFHRNKEPKLAYRQDASKKYQFLFQDSFMEMRKDFEISQPQLVSGNKKIPYDWTIYYLRKKALTAPITKEELAWIILQFNQKRGYYQLRGEDDQDASKTAETRTYFLTEKVESVTDTGAQFKGLNIYIVKLSNGEQGKYYSKTAPEWEQMEKNIIVTISIDKEGKDRLDEEGNVKKKLSVPSEEDWDKKWKLVKIKTENDLIKKGGTVGQYIYETLLKKPDQKIRGKLVRTIERKFYKDELQQILKAQKQFHPELQSNKLYKSCIDELYRHNEAHKSSIQDKDFTYLFADDIIFYQRPLKSKKFLISNCSLESRHFFKDGKLHVEPIKCIAKAHPLFQEFRLWQFLKNLKIFKKQDHSEEDITSELLKTEDEWVALFKWLNDQSEIDQRKLLSYFFPKKDIDKYRWNYVEEKKYPLNETRGDILSRLIKLNIPKNWLDKEKLEHLWHILYSVVDKNEVRSALKKYADKYDFQDDFIELFSKVPPYKNDYGSYSAKAIKKLLPLMRMGDYWNYEAIDTDVRDRIGKLINGEYDATIKERVRQKAINLHDESFFKGLPLWLASYIVYDRHAELGEVKIWKQAKDIELLKQHSLRNPIVEQIINETLRVVQDIWLEYGKGEEGYFDEIHVELSRNMKNPKAERERIAEQMNKNETTNLRIKAMLMELTNDPGIENVRPFSPMQQEILKIYEDGLLNAVEEIPEEITRILKQNQPTPAELKRYKLWLEQGYRSPYTGEIIPLNKLFTTEYEIEHIIPQSRFFDDSLSNKIICEAEVNKFKDNQLAYEFIKKNGGMIVELGYGKKVKILDAGSYEDIIKRDFRKSRAKMKKLLLDDIPDSFIERQLNDSRYISRVVKNLLSNIVRKDDEQEAIAKNLIVSNGGITSTLRNDWGLNDVWNDLISPRFIRLNVKTNSKNFGEINPNTNKFLPQIPLELSKGFSKKRIDHRHHALDALVVACTTRNHVNYLNNENAKSEQEKIRYELRNKLRRLEELELEKYENGKKVRKKITVGKQFLKPWDNFTIDAKILLENTVVSFKKNVRVINKTVNKPQKWVLKEDGSYRKEIMPQLKGDSWAIRKPLHKDTVNGLVNLKKTKIVNLPAAVDDWQNIVDPKLRTEIKNLLEKGYHKKMILNHFKENSNGVNETEISRVEIYYFTNDIEKEKVSASRSQLDESFNEKRIESVTDTGIQKILMNHLNKFKGLKDGNGKDVLPETLAFSSDGIDELNKSLIELNEGRHISPFTK